MAVLTGRKDSDPGLLAPLGYSFLVSCTDLFSLKVLIGSAGQVSTLGPSSCAEGCSCLFLEEVMRYQLIGSFGEVIETNAVPMNCFKHM